ncbi:MAG: DUF3455 domain-containing protein [Burkholderiaceae bacterium]
MKLPFFAVVSSAVATAALLTACGSTPQAAPKAAAAVPANLVPQGERAVFTWPAKGVQIYECKAAAAGAASPAPAWAFVAPEAELFNAKGDKVGTHGAGPFWQHSDGSKIVGKVKERADAPGSGAIPWLLLSATSQGGAGVLAQVTSVQRVATVGGVAPAAGCAAAADVGKQAREPYTADYVYFVKS